MAITGPSSYIPTANEFIFSWRNASDTIGGTGLILPGGTTLEVLTDLRDVLEIVGVNVEDKINDRELASASGAQIRQLILEKVVQFNKVVRSDLAGTPYPQALPKAPSIGAAPGKFVKAARDMLVLWRKINLATIPNFTGPIILLNDYDLEAYEVDYAKLVAAFEALDEAELQVKLALANRNVTQKQTYVIMKKYREVILSRYSADDPIVITLPRLTPLPGTTPAPVEATGSWDEVQSKAKLTWLASTEPDLKQYEVRWCAGSTYHTNDDITIATIQPDAPLQLLTTQGLALPGSQCVFKVYVILNSGNECGSTVVKVTRPS